LFVAKRNEIGQRSWVGVPIAATIVFE